MIVFSRLNTVLSGMPTDELTKQDVRWLNWAFDLAQSSEYPKPNFRIGAVIVHHGKVIGYGVNSIKTHPFQAKTNYLSSQLHAEMVALLAAQKTGCDLSKATIYVARSRRKNPACSYPCRFCWPVLEHAGIQTVVCYDRESHPRKICF